MDALLRRILYSPDGDGGGDAPTESGTAVAEPKTEASAPKDAEATPKSFSWDAPLPDDLPDEVKSLKGKTARDLLAAHRNLRKGLTEATISKKELEKQLAELNKRIEEGDPDAPKPVTPDEWNQTLGTYYDDGEIDEKAVADLSTRLGIPESNILGFLSYMKQEHDAFLDSAKPLVGNDYEPKEIVAWLRAGKSCYSPEAIQGFMELATIHNDASWMAGVAKAYAKHVEGGGQRFNAEGRAAPEPKMVRGEVPRSTKAKGFASRAEYLRARETMPESEWKPKLEASNIQGWPDRH